MHTVVIVEPHPLFRLGLRQLLSDVHSEITIEGYDYASLKATVDQPGRCDLLLLSLQSAADTAELASDAVKRFAPDRILLLADEEDLPESTRDLPPCVAGSVSRSAAPEVLQASVKLVLAGGSCFPAHLTRNRTNAQAAAPASSQLPPRWPSPATSGESGVSPAARGNKPVDRLFDDPDFGPPLKPGSTAHRESQLLGLTPRQYEVLLLLARGYPMKKVGRALNISVATAKAHTETLYQRLDVHNRNAAVYAAVSRGATLGWANMSAGRLSENNS